MDCGRRLGDGINCQACHKNCGLKSIPHGTSKKRTGGVESESDRQRHRLAEHKRVGSKASGRLVALPKLMAGS